MDARAQRAVGPPLLGLLLAGLLAGPVAATEVYRWVDQDGVTHFTENPPPGVAAERVTRADAPPIDSSGIAGESAYDTEAHAEHMAEWRAEREEARAEARERERERALAEQAAARRPVVVEAPGHAVWWPPGYLRPPHHRPGLPPFRPPHRPPRPEPPISPPSTPPSVLKPR